MLIGGPWTAVLAQSSTELLRTVWGSAEISEARGAARRLLDGGIGFGELRAGLSVRPAIDFEAAAGVHEDFFVTSDGQRHHFAWVEPEAYDPAVPTAVRFVLHGGVSTNDRERGADGPIDNLRHLPWITVLPSAWQATPWWTESQAENLAGILWRLKGRYNIDSDRVALQGISDGGGGVWFQAMLANTPWSSFLPVISHPGVLPAVSGDNELHLANLRNKRFLVINTVDDPLYPDSAVRPLMDYLAGRGVDLSYLALAGHGHTTRWWPDERERIDRFVEVATRVPHPRRVEWAASNPAWGRSHWLVIEAIDSSPASPPEDWNDLGGSRFFSRGEPFAHVVAERDGNVIRVSASGAARLRLLISPEAFDFEGPLTIESEGTLRQVDLEEDREVMLEGFLRDRSPSMLYGDEVIIEWPLAKR